MHCRARNEKSGGEARTSLPLLNQLQKQRNPVAEHLVPRRVDLPPSTITAKLDVQACLTGQRFMLRWNRSEGESGTRDLLKLVRQLPH